MTSERANIEKRNTVKVKVKSVPISQIKINPNNPRTIYNRDMDLLVKSLQEFPEMLELREIVVDEDMVVLGGNMRLMALRKIAEDEARRKVKVHDTCLAKIVTGLTPEQKKEFIIKDNGTFGQWDMEALANSWSTLPITEWGLNIPNYAAGIDANNMTEENIDITEDFDPIGNSQGLHKVVFTFDGQEEAEAYLRNLNVTYKKYNIAWHVNMSTRERL